MRVRRLAVLIFTLGAGVALTLGILGSCAVKDSDAVGRSLKALAAKVYS